MLRKMLAVFGVAALVAALAGPALAQETQMKWKTDGKRYWQVEEAAAPFVMPKTRLIELTEKQEGAFLGTKYVGKRLERVYFLEVPLAVEAAKNHECTWKLVYEKKAVNKRHFCLKNGTEMACCGMTAAGECLGMK